MYKLYMNALQSIKDGSNRNDEQSICHNLSRIMGKMPEPYTVAQFCTEVYKHLYGKTFIFPVEGSKEEHDKYKDKFSTDNPYSAKRFELIDSMIEHCKTRPVWVLRYSTENRKWEERSQDQFALQYRAKLLGPAIKYQYSITPDI